MRIRSALLIIVMFALTAVAADANGKWIAQLTDARGGVSERVFTFKVAGDKLTGAVANFQVATPLWQEKGKNNWETITLKTQNIPAQEISEGKISGDQISFVLDVLVGGQPAKNIYTGKISGDEIYFTMEVKLPQGASAPAGKGPQGPQKIVAKKVGAN
jgi:hypothetical protein